jgi:hypothetical protein
VGALSRASLDWPALEKQTCASPSAEASSLKLDVFRRLWTKERRIDAPPDGGDVADVAAAIALDVLTLLRGDGGLAATAEAA